MCGEVQTQDASVSIKKESCWDFVEVVEAATPEMEDGGQATINELQEINLGMTKDHRRIFLSAILNDEEIAQYEQLL